MAHFKQTEQHKFYEGTIKGINEAIMRWLYKNQSETILTDSNLISLFFPSYDGGWRLKVDSLSLISKALAFSSA